MATTIITGIVCDNTCLGFQPGDDTPDYLGLFGPLLGNLMSRPFTLDIGASAYSLTINNQTQTFGFNDPYLSISFNDPLLVSFSPGAALFTATGSTLNPFGFTNIFGFAVPETEFLCPIPGVPEPGTWAMFLIGFAIIAMIRKRRPHGPIYGEGIMTVWYRRRPGHDEWVKIEVIAPMPPYTDEELAALKLMGEELTIADWDRMTPAQKLKEQSEWLARLWAVNGNINLMDPIDPAWANKDTEDEGDDYRTEQRTNY